MGQISLCAGRPSMQKSAEQLFQRLWDSIQRRFDLVLDSVCNLFLEEGYRESAGLVRGWSKFVLLLLSYFKARGWH